MGKRPSLSRAKGALIWSSDMKMRQLAHRGTLRAWLSSGVAMALACAFRDGPPCVRKSNVLGRTSVRLAKRCHVTWVGSTSVLASLRLVVTTPTVNSVVHFSINCSTHTAPTPNRRLLETSWAFFSTFNGYRASLRIEALELWSRTNE